MKRLISLILCILMLLCLMVPLASAKETTTEKIRVGWFDSPYFLESENGEKSGYAYDYLQKISSYTGWEYEYVKAGWYDLYQMLVAGEIDILADVTWSDDSLSEILYSSDIMGSEDLYIYTKEDNTEISANDHSTLNGKDIAILSEEGEISMLNTWLEANNISANVIVVTDDDVKIANDLVDGKYDAVVNVTFFDTYNEAINPIIKVDSDVIYFAINKNRQDIKNEIDETMQKIQNNNRSYVNNLYEKYFGDAGNIKYLSLEEEEWIKNNGVIRIGYRDNYSPFSTTDKDGNATGFIKSFIDYISKKSTFKNLKFELYAYDTSEDAIKALQNGDVDCIFPITQEAYSTDTLGFSITDAVVSIDANIIIRSDNNKININDKLRVAVNKGNQDYEKALKKYSPQWEIVYFDSTEECLKGIKDKKADCLLMASIRINSYESLMNQYGLSAVSTGESYDISFATLKENPIVYSILDKLVNEISDDEAGMMLSTYSLGEQRVTVDEFVNDNIGIVIITILFIAFLIAFAIFLLQYNTKAEKLNAELLEAIEKAEAASKAKTDFLFNMSHDIRTPMNAILGFNNMAIRDIDNKEKALKSLKKTQISGQALLSVINDILDTSRLESGKVDSNVVKANVEKCFMENEVILNGLAKTKGVSLNFKVEEMEHKYVYVDITHVDRILTNIISNAIKYTPEGGEVNVSAMEIDSDRDGYGKYRFVVADNGIGISKEFQEKMFLPFTREENTTTSGVIGTGLGLSLVKSFIDLLDGKIECESEQGKGTTMTVELNFKLQEGKGVDFEMGKPDVKDVSLEGKRILLVEDNEMNREITMDILFEYKADVITAENGKAAVDAINSRGISSFDFVLMDIQMPIMDGYEATRIIRETYPDYHLPIIALSANAFEQDKQKSLEIGMDAHIAKPIDIPILISTISELI